MTVYWVNFRSTAAPSSPFPGDGANSTYCTGDSYPTGRKIGGLYDFGWVATNGNKADKSSVYGSTEHFYGYNASTANVDSATFRISGLTVGHTYRLHMSLGTLDSGLNNGFTVYSDNRTTSLYPVAGTTVSSGSLMDASGAVRSNPSDWTSNEVYVDITATTTNFYFCKGPSPNSYSAYFNAIGIEDLNAGGASASNVMMMGV